MTFFQHPTHLLLLPLSFATAKERGPGGEVSPPPCYDTATAKKEGALLVQRRHGGAEMMTNLLPVFLGVVLLVFSIASGSLRNVLIGVALVGTGVVGFVGPCLAPSPAGLSAERVRARRAAAIILPNGLIYLALGILLRTAIPASERGGTTALIALFAIVMGILSILSGFGALARARRPDDAPPPVPDAQRADTENRGNV